MKPNQSQNLKEKSTYLNNKQKKTQLECPCIRFILSILKNKNQCKDSVSTTSGIVNYKTIGANKKMELQSTLKKSKKPRIVRLPKIGCTIPFLMTLFNNLSNSGEVCMETSDVASAVNLILKAKMDLDEGKAWNGKIEIAENLHLKLYKSGLVLHHKQ